MNIFEELTRIAKEFEEVQVKYALIGGVAMSFYTEPRFTRDVDLLIGAGPSGYQEVEK